MKHLVAMLGICIVGTLSASTVKLEGQSGSWQLIRDGKPYFIKGAGGGGSMSLLKAIGGNSNRTWGSEKAKEQLDEAQRLGMTLTVGHWFGHQQHGFDYTNPTALTKQKEDLRQVVLAHRNHPALLMWALGNEMENGNSHPRELWAHIEDCAKMVKKLDPNHPVMTVVAEIPNDKVKLIHELCPSVDIVGINSYGGATSVAERWAKAGGTKPYVITEFGPAGQWETKLNDIGCPEEQTSTQKGEVYARIWKSIEAQRGKMCLGGYAFTWGWKVEATPTWYGLLLPDDSILAAAEELSKSWGKKPANRCPAISPIRINTNRPKVDEIVTASAVGKDPDGDHLRWQWVLLQESGNYMVIGTGEPMPKGFPEAIISGQGTAQVKVKLPGGGKYRLYAYLFDGKHGAAYANVPLQGVGEPPKAVAPQANLPFALEGHWVPSGYMGNAGAVKMSPGKYHGREAIKVDYSARDNWAGVLWQSPANDWHGDHPGGFDLTGATCLEFYARGEVGGESISFKVGNIDKGKYPDSDRAELKDVRLRKQWTRYRVPLDGRDLSQIKTGFGWVLGGQGKPLTFYLSGMRFIKE